MSDTTISTASNEVLEHELTTIAAQIAAATCRFVLLIAELDRRQAWGACWGCTSMAHWLSWRCSLSPGAAREHVRVARALAGLPVMTAAFGRAELSYSKVRALTRVATVENEAELVGLATIATAAQLERIIGASVVAMSDPAEREALREVRFSVGDDGLGTTRARLAIDQHAIVERAIDAAVEVMDVPAGTPIAQVRADALVRVCESYLASGDGARSGGDRNHGVVHVEVDRSGIVAAETESGVVMSIDAARRLLCDASVQGMLGDLGLPIGVGRTTRTIPRRLRRAIKRRSGGGCEWVGCGERRYVEAHHVVHWEHGGPTELGNLVNLCWHHHHLVHEGGWRLVHDGRGGVRCYRPDGTELLDPVPSMSAPPPMTLVVDSDALEPSWAGERFDLSACVDAVMAAGR